jgi:hypothetical protein
VLRSALPSVPALFAVTIAITPGADLAARSSIDAIRPLAIADPITYPYAALRTTS